MGRKDTQCDREQSGKIGIEREDCPPGREEDGQPEREMHGTRKLRPHSVTRGRNVQRKT